MLSHRGTAQQRGAPDTCTWRLSVFPRPVGCRRGATAGPWHRPQWTTPVDSHTLAPVQADRARQHEQARSVLRQARAASAEEAVSSLPPEVHAARRPLEPDMSRVPENRENRLMRPDPPRNPMRETAAPRKTSRPNVFSPTDYSGVVATDLRPSSDCRVSVRHSRQTRDFRDPMTVIGLQRLRASRRFVRMMA